MKNLFLNPQTTKLQLAKNITLPDFLVFLSINSFFFGFAFTLPLSTPYRVITGCFFIPLSIFLLLPINRPIKNWQKFFFFFTFLSTKKTYSSKDNLLPVLPSHQKPQIIEIEGLDVNLLSPTQQSQILSLFKFLLKSISKDFKIIKLSTPLSLTPYISYLASLSISKNSWLNHQVFQATKVLTSLQSHPSLFQNRYFLYLNSLEKSQINSLISSLTQLNLQPKLHDNKFNKVFFSLLHYPRYLPSSPLPLIKELSFFKDYYKINDLYCSLLTISSFPTSLPNFWLSKLQSLSNTTLIISSSSLSYSSQQKFLNKTIQNLKTNIQSSHDPTIRSDFEVSLSSFESLVDQISNGIESLQNTSIAVLCYENTLEKLHEVVFQTKEAIKSLDALPYDNIHRQFQSFKSFSPQLPETPPTFQFPLPLQTLAACFPFQQQSFSDPQGQFLGFTYQHSPIFFNPFLRDKNRKNSNMFIIGTSGSGKSFTSKKLLNHQLMIGNRVFIIDPEREYKTLCENWNGTWIDCSGGKNNRINPLQIFSSLEDDKDSSSPLSSHLRFLEEFFKLTCPEITYQQLLLLINLSEKLYSNFNITNSTNLTSLSPNDFPIFTDFLTLIQSVKSSSSNTDLEILERYISSFTGSFSNAHFWNGSTTLNPSSQIIVFDLHTLLESGNQMIINTQIFLLLRFLTNEIQKNKQINEISSTKTKKHLLILIDEAHLLIDNDRQSSLKFLFRTTKRIRKYDGMMLIISQSINDFIADESIKKYSAGIINSCQFQLTFQLNPNDLSSLDTLLKSSGGLTIAEKSAIATFETGHCLFSVSGKSRFLSKINVTDFEKTLFSSHFPISSSSSKSKLQDKP